MRTAEFGGEPLQQGNKVTLVAYNQNQRPICLTTVVTDIACISIGTNGVSNFLFQEKKAHGYAPYGMMWIDASPAEHQSGCHYPDTPLALQCYSGLLADVHGTVRGL